MIVVTGGAGFIGSNLVFELNRRGEREIVIVDRLDESDKYRNLIALDFIDLVDPDDVAAVERTVGLAQRIFHLGACTDTTNHDGRFMVETNFNTTKRLLELALPRQIPFVYASSAAVYGEGRAGFIEDPRCESPLNVYGFSKLLCDRYVRALLPHLSSPVVGLRYFNVYGPQEGHKGAMASGAYHFWQDLHAGRALTLFEGSHAFRRDFVFVDDAVAVTLELAELGVSGVFNCGTGEARSFQRVAETLRTLHSQALPLRTTPFPPELEGRYQRHTQADLTQLRQAGCRRVFQPLEAGLAAYHEALRRNGGYLSA